jgi:hypothetical protein
MGKPNGCKDCFYALKDASEFPCNICKGYDYYLHKDVYKEETDNKAWAKVVEGLNGTSKEDMWFDFDSFSKEAYEKEVKGDPHYWPKFEGPIVGFNDYDTVNKPKHYMLFDKDEVRNTFADDRGIEVRDVITKLVEKLTSENTPGNAMFESDYVQMMQYGMRFMDKNGVEDLKKMRWYLDKLIEAY